MTSDTTAPTGFSAAPGSATATLVLTDVEGSTRLWSRYPDLMSEVMVRHHAIVHGAVTSYGGWRPVDQGEGDAVFAAFDSASAAVAAVVQFQQQLAAERWPVGIAIAVRVGIHAGEVIARDGNLFGSTVNRCARLRGLGAGGQVLLSAPTFELARDRLPDGVAVVDLGDHRMKDLTRPERVYQLLIPGLRSEFPPLAGLDRARHNLPVQTSSFIGREREVAHLVGVVGSERLVTVVGFGGMGKTRLALQVAGELATGDGDGVWFIDLSNETDATRVPSLIAAAVGIGETGDGPLPALLSGLRDTRLLLVLDNCEQLLPDLAGLVDQLLRAAPDIRILATSREALRLRAEHAYPVQPLPVPPPQRVGNGWTDAELRSLSAYAAVMLFLTRAAAARSDFVLTATNAAAVAGICARLEGLPLALELAAARTRVLSPEALLPRLENALTVLVGGSRDLPTRQQTLRATIAWSYDTLRPDAQHLLSRLAMFPGSFTLDAAEAVTEPALTNEESDLDVLDGIESLLDRSLIQFHPRTADQPDDRYSLLVSIREFATHQLPAATRSALSVRHLDYYTRLTTLQNIAPRRAALLRRAHVVSTELHNVRAALETAHLTGTADEEVMLAENVVDLFREKGLHQECRRITADALSRPAAVTVTMVRLMTHAAHVESGEGFLDRALELSERAVAAARRLDDPLLLASTLCEMLEFTSSRTRVAALMREIVDTAARVPPTATASRDRITYRWNLAMHQLIYVDRDTALRAGRDLVSSSVGLNRVYDQSNLLFSLNSCGQFAEAAAIAELFENPQRLPDANDVILAYGVQNAAQLRVALGDFTAAAADLDRLQANPAMGTLVTTRAEADLLRAAVLRAQQDETAAEQLLVRLLDDPSDDLNEILLARTRWLLAVIRRETGQPTQAQVLLDQAWAVVAGRDVHHLDLILECLLERASQLTDTDPAQAVRVLGLVAAHRRTYALLDGVTYDTDAMLDDLRSRLGDHEVTDILAATRAQPLPNTPSWIYIDDGEGMA